MTHLNPKHASLLLVFAVAPLALAAAPIVPRGDNFEITTDAIIQTGAHHIPDAAADGAIQIRGNDITVDFQNAQIIGSRDAQEPNGYTGIGIVITGDNVTLRNVGVRGYKVGIYHEGGTGLTVDNCNVSANFRERLQSTFNRESGEDWLWPDANYSSTDGWLERYGAGIYIKNAKNVTLRRIASRVNQNGIIFDRVTDSRVYDCDCSFLSGWGIALWASSRNVISRNAFDFCVRGYSHDFYARGQNSAGILLYEQSSDNVIAENSATHGGCGLFMHGGRGALDQMDPAGSNGNLVIKNDFSFAAAHGIEVRVGHDNRLIANRTVGCTRCGIRAAYAPKLEIAHNQIRRNGTEPCELACGGICVQNSPDTTIYRNEIENNEVGVTVWWQHDAHLRDKPWIRAHRDESPDHFLGGNLFDGNETALRVRQNARVQRMENDLDQADIDTEQAGSVERVVRTGPYKPIPHDYPTYGESNPRALRDQLAGRHRIFLTKWGPYSYKRKAIEPATVRANDQAVLTVLAPPGPFRVRDASGLLEVTPPSGQTPAHITLKPTRPGVWPFALVVEADGTPLHAQGVIVALDWNVKFYRWSESEDPRDDPESWQSITARQPLLERNVTDLDFQWQDASPGPNVPADRFATVAETRVTLPASTYSLRTVSDDGIRVWVDDEIVIEDWTWHPPKEIAARLELTGGTHRIRVEHFEIAGWSQLTVEFKPPAWTPSKPEQ